MRTGMRLTYIGNGDPLLGQTWEYKGVTGVEAINQKVDDSFFILSKLNVVTYVDLDSVQLAKQNSIAVPKIQLSQNEYFSLVNIDVTVNAATTLIS